LSRFFLWCPGALGFRLLFHWSAVQRPAPRSSNLFSPSALDGPYPVGLNRLRTVRREIGASLYIHNALISRFRSRKN
jgi:hypothetical protein